MPFRLALSGLNAAQADLSVTANNIANTATNGFKGSRAEFAELFSVSPQGVSSVAIGNGVRVSNVAQQFTQGNIDFTDNSLDLAISGEGFFRPAPWTRGRGRCAPPWSCAPPGPRPGWHSGWPWATSRRGR